MLSGTIQQQLLQLINKATGSAHKHLQLQPVGSGSINQTFKIIFPYKSYFLKCNSFSQYPGMLHKEKSALQFLTTTNTITAAAVILDAEIEDKQFLVLDWIESGKKDESFWKTFGEQLAALHLVSNSKFGWHENNYMGSVPLQNKWEENWTEFFVQQRLHPLVQQCFDKQLLSTNEQKGFENVFKKLPLIFEGNEKPSLLHGDLWSGNFMCNNFQQPVLIDPAIYFGHRSMDLAMTTLFGGYDENFYQSYHYHFPLPQNYKEQWPVCNLYPLLIHLLLFGQSYLPQIQQTLRKFV